MFKRIFIMVMIFLFLLTLIGCQKSDEEQGASMDQVIPMEDGTQEELNKIESMAPAENMEQDNGATEDTGTSQEIPTRTTELDEKVNINELPIGGIGGTSEFPWYDHLEDIQELFKLDVTMVFRGIKEDLSTPVTIYDEEGFPYNHYCETPIRVLEVYYGDAQTGDVITVREKLSIREDESGVKSVFYQEYTLPLEKEEYIFILRRSENIANDGTSIGGVYSGHSFHKLSDYETFKQKVQDGTATDRETFGFEVMDYYLNDLDPALDLEEETIKMARLDKDATYEEALAALTEEQKGFLHQMAERYGTK